MKQDEFEEHIKKLQSKEFKTNRKASTIINNFYSLITIIIMSVAIILYVNYVVPIQKKRDIKEQILKCQKDVTCFDKVYNGSLLKEGKYKLDGGMIYSEYMKTILKDKIKLDEVNNRFKKIINISQKEDLQRFLKITYEVIENDKKHPNKKKGNKKCKLYAGYLLVSFKINGKQIYRIQIDFMQYDIKEIEQRIKCIMDSFNYYAKYGIDN